MQCNISDPNQPQMPQQAQQQAQQQGLNLGQSPVGIEQVLGALGQQPEGA